MGTEILKSFGNLQSELDQARSSLKGVDENIKRLIGRDPSELPLRPGQKRLPLDDKGRPNLKNISRSRNFTFENDEPPSKRRSSNISVFKRLSERTILNDDIHHGSQKQIISKVIVTPKEVPSREEALEAQNKDEKYKARNRRMFGALLGTLQKFQQEETKLKSREDKRAQLERKIEEHEIKEKEEIKKERQELFLSRKKKQTEIKIIELKMMRMKEYAAWEVGQKPRSNFILTKAEPRIHYLPRRMNDKSKELLEASKVEIEARIEKKKQEVFEELKRIEERIKRTFDAKYGSKETKASQEKHESEEHDEQEDHGDHFDEVLTELPTANEEKEDKQDIEKETDIKVQTEPAQQCESNKEIQNDTTETVDHNIDENKVSQEIVLLNENLNGVNDQNSTKVEGETIL